MFTQTITRALSRLGLDQRGADPHLRQPAPMLLQKADTIFSSPDWTYELGASEARAGGTWDGILQGKVCGCTPRRSGTPNAQIPDRSLNPRDPRRRPGSAS